MGFFHWRRVPGTLALAITNLIAAGMVVEHDAFGYSIDGVFGSYYLITNGVLLLIAAFLLLIAAVTRRWLPLNLGSFLSLFVWSSISFRIIALWLAHEISLAPLEAALLFWMIIGQASMLFVPLITRGRWTA